MSNGKSRFQQILDAEHSRAAGKAVDPGPVTAADLAADDAAHPAPPDFRPTEHDLLAAEQQHKGVVASVRATTFRADVSAPLPRVPYSPPRLVVPPAPAPGPPPDPWWRRIFRR